MNKNKFVNNIKRLPKVYLTESEKYESSDDVVSFCIGTEEEYADGRFYTSNVLFESDHPTEIIRATIRVVTEVDEDTYSDGRKIRKTIGDGIEYRVTDNVLHVVFIDDVSVETVYTFTKIVSQSTVQDPYDVLMEKYDT